MRTLLFALLSMTLLGVSCTSDNPPENPPVKNNTPPAPRVKGPSFNGDSAYAFTKTQVDFGPRVPDSKAHTLCGDYITNKLKAYGLSVKVQETPATLYNGTPIHIKNIMGQYKPERKERVLILAHWDTRPWADEDTARKDQPIDGANDGASGVAVMLEIARVLQEKDPNIGVDLLFADAEDEGNNDGAPETWCLGSQYWAQHLEPGYAPRFGILLDMVGGKGAVFPREGTSVYFAADVVEKVWSSAAALGYGQIFVNDITGETTDDHYFVNRDARIPTIDIVHYDTQTHRYGSFHHTHADNMEIIDRNTLEIVGTVLIDVIYNENPAAVK